MNRPVAYTILESQSATLDSPERVLRVHCVSCFFSQQCRERPEPRCCQSLGSAAVPGAPAARTPFGKMGQSFAHFEQICQKLPFSFCYLLSFVVFGVFLKYLF